MQTAQHRTRSEQKIVEIQKKKKSFGLCICLVRCCKQKAYYRKLINTLLMYTLLSKETSGSSKQKNRSEGKHLLPRRSI